MKSLAPAAALLLAAASLALADPTMPNEFEAPGTQLANISSLGGVSSYNCSIDPATIYTGNSLRISANFIAGSFLNFSSFSVGTLGITAPNLNVPAGANTFSMTVQWPAPPGGQTLSVYVTIREDDNNDGQISFGNDDYWESPEFFLQPGTSVYNIPVSTFELANPGSGNGVRNFTTTSRMAYVLTFTTRPSHPGGRITTPVTFHVDHVGLYVGDQTLPAPPCTVDWNGDGQVTSSDISAFLTTWLASLGTSSLEADFNGDGVVNSTDISAYIAAWLNVVSSGGC